MKRLWLITKEDFVNLITNPMWVFYATLFPLAMVVIMGYLTRNAFGDEVTSYDYYGITMMIYIVLNSGMTSANAFMEERIKKPNMRIIYAPGSVSSIYLSKILASFFFSILFYGLDLLILILLFHVRINHTGLVLLLFAMIDLLSVTFGIMLCCIVKTEMMTNQIQSILVNLLILMGGVLFSLDGYGKAARMISLCSPVKWIVDTVFQLIYDNSLRLFAPVMLGLIVCQFIMLIVCRCKFRKEDCIC